MRRSTKRRGNIRRLSIRSCLDRIDGSDRWCRAAGDQWAALLGALSIVAVLSGLTAKPARAANSSPNCSIKIEAPILGEKVTDSGDVSGTASKPARAYLWAFAHRVGLKGWWPQGGGAIDVGPDGHWLVTVTYGVQADAGHDFEILVEDVGPVDNSTVEAWVASAPARGYPPMALPAPADGCALAQTTVHKIQ